MHEPEGVVLISLALAYAVTAWITNIFLITREQAAVISVGILTTAHGTVIAAHLVHECALMTLFRARPAPMAWIAGASAARGEKIVAAICSRMAEALQKEFFV